MILCDTEESDTVLKKSDEIKSMERVYRQRWYEKYEWKSNPLTILDISISIFQSNFKVFLSFEISPRFFEKFYTRVHRRGAGIFPGRDRKAIYRDQGNWYLWRGKRKENYTVNFYIGAQPKAFTPADYTLLQLSPVSSNRGASLISTKRHLKSIPLGETSSILVISGCSNLCCVSRKGKCTSAFEADSRDWSTLVMQPSISSACILLRCLHRIPCIPYFLLS